MNIIIKELIMFCFERVGVLRLCIHMSMSMYHSDTGLILVLSMQFY